MNRKRIVKKHRRSRRAAKFLFLLCCVGCFLGGFQLRSLQTAMAADTFSKDTVIEAGSEEASYTPVSEHGKPRQKYYTSIGITYGESLYSIAERYMSYEYDSMEDYMQEVRKINHIIGDELKQGSYITIPYYK